MNALPLASLVYDVPVLGPIGVGNATLSTVWQRVMDSDINRRGVIFANPGANIMRVAPANLLTQPANEEGSFAIYPQEELAVLAENEHENVNCAWMAWVDVGDNQPFTALNFTGTNAAAAAPAPLSSLQQGSAITSPLGSGALLGTDPVSVIGSNAQRRGITFHNPGTVPLAFCPANLVPVLGAGSIVLLPGATKTFMAQPKSRIRVNCGWSAIAQSGSDNPLSVLEHLG